MNSKRKSFALINLGALLVVLLTAFISCSNTSKQDTGKATSQEDSLNVKKQSPQLTAEQLDSIRMDSINQLPTTLAAQLTEDYIPLLKGKRVGVVANQTSLIGSTHLVDSLLSLGIDVKRVFSPEHGFRGDHDAGAKVKHSKDSKTGLPIYSLHGKTKKPSKQSIADIDVLLFDIQDVGVRFYTYLSTLHYVIEAAGESNKKVIVLDRPNPNASYIDGPVLQPEFKSFLGLHPVPVVYGMSIGEYALMINGEKWCKAGVQCDLTVIQLQNWNHQKEYRLPVAPSPNLPTQNSIYLYPHLCFFEGTVVSVGRGTDHPFEIFGHPNWENAAYKDSLYSFTPRSIPGKSKYPKLEGKKCFGENWTSPEGRWTFLSLWFLQDAIKYTKTDKFFDRPEHFNLLAGNNTLIEQLKNKKSTDEIVNSWQSDLEAFKNVRAKYLLYP